MEKKIVGYTFEINSLDSGRTSGLVELNNKALVTVLKARRNFANVGALLAAHSIGIEVKEKLVQAPTTNLEIEIPVGNESFYKNFYSREDAQLNFDKAADKLNSDGKNLLEQVRRR